MSVEEAAHATARLLGSKNRHKDQITLLHLIGGRSINFSNSPVLLDKTCRTNSTGLSLPCSCLCCTFSLCIDHTLSSTRLCLNPPYLSPYKKEIYIDRKIIILREETIRSIQHVTEFCVPPHGFKRCFYKDEGE